MPSVSVEICNRKGLHARASAAFARLSNEFASKVTVTHMGASAEGGSIMDLMLLAASKGCRVEISAEGEDEDAALTTLSKLIEDRFGEED